ncbi:DUF1648 domain-containing protein [Lactiplantibacillus plajomi]|uniref:DUF1648 domain-containing protein n=1 Tax=Lactiplantibacillus plajomi TaxID=1457217 RepID=A0ABV6K6I4_9LACO|nr:DUF1648 domain-containing protein [Lactiplantibacillus plajomi]
MKIKVQAWLSYVVILLPMVYGIWNYRALPNLMATHFGGSDLHPDGFMTKPVAVFGLPLLMIAIQLFSVTMTHLNAKHKGAAPRFERVVIWIVPLIAVVTYTMTIAYNLGHLVDIWRISISMVGVVFIAMGNYLPTVSATAYQRMHRGFNLHPEAWQYWKYRFAYLLVGSGVLLLLSILTVPMVSAVIIGVVVVAMLTMSLIGLIRAR